MTAIEMVLAFVVLLGILVLIHEFGHYATAKLLGVRVETFSVGFGPRLFGFQWGETDYRVSAIPLGGYVKMTGENPDEAITGDPAELGARPRWQRFLVFVMGAVLNIVLALVVMTVFFYRTGQTLEPPDTPPVVTEVVAGSPAEAAGVREGDLLVEVAGRDPRDPNVLVEEIFLSPGTTKTMVFDREGEKFQAEVEIGYESKYRSGDPGLRLTAASDEGPPDENTNPIERVIAGSPAEAAGLLPGDRIVAVGGRELPSRSELVTVIQKAAGRAVALAVERGGQRLEFEVVPEGEEGRGEIGVWFVRERMSVAAAAAASLRYNYSNASLLFVTLKKLLRGDVSLRVMSGPGEIAAAARQAYRSGLDVFLHFMAFVSLQLGIINLLPVPMLDGGHIFILLIESVLRRELSNVLKERVMQAGLVFLILFAGVVIYFDVVKWLS